jgi:hypothetical protein
MSKAEMTAPESQPLLRLSPSVRFILEFQEHAKRVSVFDDRWADRVADRTERARDASIKQGALVAKLDAVLLFLVATKNVHVPIFGFDLSTLSYASEGAFFLSAFTALFASIGFINWQGYTAVLNEWCRTRDPEDPEYLQSSYSAYEFFLKVFRAESTVQRHRRSDFFEPERGFRIASSFVKRGMSVAFLALFFLHFAILIAAFFSIWELQRFGVWGTAAFLLGCSIAHVFAAILLGLYNTAFKFRVAEI